MDQDKLKRINVTNFLRQYESENTKKSYKTGLKQYFNLIYPSLKDRDLDSLSDKYLDEERDYRVDILTFRESLSGGAPKTVKLRLNTVRVFLDDNGISFPKRFFNNLNGKGNGAITWEEIPSNDELKRIVEYMPIHGKALTLLLASSGMRIGEVVQLKVSDFTFDSEPVRIRVRGEYTKTGKRRITFMSPEAKDAVEEWLNYRSQYVKQANGRSARFKRTESDTIFPFRQENFNTIWRNALIKAELLKIDERTRRITMRPHNLRKFFRLRVGRYGRDEAEAMMGHQTGLNAIYARFDDADERLEEVYKKAISDLSIYKRAVQVVQLDEEMKNTIRKLEDQVNALVHNELAKDAKITYLTVNDEKKTKEIFQLKRQMKKKIEEDEETERRIAKNEQDLQSWKTAKKEIEEMLFNSRMSKNRKVTVVDEE